MKQTQRKMRIQKTTILPNLRNIAGDYDVFIFDLWGVTHNGKQSFPGAIESFTELKALGKPVYFLSNAPRRKSVAMDQLIDRGVPRDLYVDLMTSGEDCYEHLRDRPDAFYQGLGDKLYHLGPDKDKNLFEGLPYKNVDLEQADFILNTGTLTFEDTVDDYQEILEKAASLNLPMVCANPDKIVLYGDGEAICAGLIADRYKEMGGKVVYHGKPDRSIFAKTFVKFNMNGKRVLMVGDSLGTDIKGAQNAGIDSLFILSGIHKQKTPEQATALYPVYGVTPTYVQEYVTW